MRTSLRSLSVSGSVVALAACAPDQPARGAPAPVAFGGERLEFGQSQERGAVLSPGVGTCQRVPAVTTDPLLDDFEQDSVFIHSTPERRGVWYLANDGSPDGTSEPESYAVARGGFAGSNHALRYRVERYTDWGAVAGFQLRYQSATGIKCPFNASAFDGLAFAARGSGRVRVRLHVPESVPTNEDGGRCKSSCWDSHGSFIYLKDEWVQYRLPWSSFAQQGWGTPSRLNVAEVLGVAFAIGRDDQPTELWLDDVRFVPREDVASPRSAEAP